MRSVESLAMQSNTRMEPPTARSLMVLVIALGSSITAQADLLTDTGSGSPAGLLSELTSLLSTIAATVDTPDISAISGAVNFSTLNGSIDISGTSVRIMGVDGNVTARADAVGSMTSDATAFAINGNAFFTTVMGAMNSATLDSRGNALDSMGKTVELMSTVTASLNVAKYSGDGSVTFALPAITAPTAASDVPVPLASFDAFTVLATGDANAIDMAGLSAELNATGRAKVQKLQGMSTFNMALNAAPIVGGATIAATVADQAWFLNQQTGVIELANLQVATTALGAMNSSLSHLGKNLTAIAK